MCKLSEEAVGDILKEGRIFEVGGAVRDKLLHTDIKAKDRDYLVTGIPFKSLSKILRNHGKVDLVGQSFGVIKFTQFRNDKAYTFDITLPRKEHSTGMGHKDFEVTYDPALKVEDDLSRRDFTINAMALALDTDELIDPLDGRVDLEKKQIRVVYPASFEDDPLRMIRAIQFAARLEFLIEPATYEAICRNAELIKTVSPERINEELNKMLMLAEQPSTGFRLMQTSGLLKYVMPELEECVGVDQPGGYHAYDVFEHTMRVVDAAPKDLRIRLAALFHDIRKPQTKRPSDTGATFYSHEVQGAKTAVKVMKRLRYSNEMIDDVKLLVERHMYATPETDKGLRRLIRRLGTERIFDLLDLRRADVVGQGKGGSTDDVDELEDQIRAEIDRRPPFSRKDLALDGEDIMKLLKIKASPLVGIILDFLMEVVLDNPEDNTKKDLESLAREFYQNNIDRISDEDSDK